jgi:hypothetical protein
MREFCYRCKTDLPHNSLACTNLRHLLLCIYSFKYEASANVLADFTTANAVSFTQFSACNPDNIFSVLVRAHLEHVLAPASREADIFRSSSGQG